MEKEEVEATVAPLEPVELSMYFIGTNEMPDDQLVAEKLSQLIEERLNATVKLTFLDWGSYDSKLNLLLASGESIDLLFQANWMGTSYSSNVSKGFLYDITDLIDTYAKEAKAILPPFLLDGVSVDGRIYGMPTYKEVGSSQGIAIVKSIVDELGIDVSSIKTPADVDALLAQIKAAKPELTTFIGNPIIDGKQQSNFAGAKMPLSVDYDSTIVEISSESQAMRDSANKAKEYFELGYYPADYVTNFDPKAIFKAGNGAVMALGLKPGKDKELSLEYGVEMVQVELTDVYIDATEGAGSIMSIGANSNNPERALMLMNLLYTDQELINTLAFGVEGVHWVKTGEYSIDYAEGISADNIGYSHGISWEFGNQYLNYVWPNEAQDKWEQFNKFAENAISPKLMGFTFNGESVSAQMAAVANVEAQYGDALMKNPDVVIEDTLIEYNKALKEAGIEVIRDEMQKQIDDFLAK